MCLMNSDITESLNRPDLAHIWKVLGKKFNHGCALFIVNYKLYNMN